MTLRGMISITEYQGVDAGTILTLMTFLSDG